MDQDAKKTVLRMIPYGMYVLTTKSKDGNDVGAATVNWLTQNVILSASDCCGCQS